MIEKYEKVKGQQIGLSEGRCVFISHPPGAYLVEFRSKEGSTTRLMLSEEAVHALSVLASSPDGHDFKIEKATRQRYLEARWQLAPESEA